MWDLLMGALRILELGSALHEMLRNSRERKNAAQERTREDVRRVNAWLRTQGPRSAGNKEQRT
jgi:hypothetical protein